MRRGLGALATGLSAAAVLVGCGTSTPGASGRSSPASLHGPTYRIDAASVGGLGTVLVDEKGFTLYLFVSDHHGSHSRCRGICAFEWPPLVLPKGVTEPIAGAGVKKSLLLGTTRRAEETLQVTYAGWPLYRWFDDTAPSEATGEGLNNLGALWLAISTRRQPVR